VILAAILATVAAVFGVAAGFVFGLARGRRAVWRELLDDRRLGHLALERLGRAHGARVVLFEPPG
jgi:hypothetical protein